ncbi:MAG TPA: GNAT family N-acetyltransferase [Alphaproteobacteria bacterium]|nr:GNAT family N-acetyltransferase [Alphaproteobacteria bacterium]
MRYTFQTERLLLRPYGLEDCPHVHRLWTDASIVWWRANDPMTEDETRDLHGRYSGINGAASSGLGWWLIFDRTNDSQVIGQAALKPLPDLPGETEVAWQVLRDRRGKGYATEAGRVMLRHGFGAMELDRIVAPIVPGNAPSVAVARRLGMTKSNELVKAGLLHHLFRIGRTGWSVLE